MTLATLRELLYKNLITDEQFQKIEAVQSKKVFSVFYELRTILYLGILLFSTGIGLLIYKNIGQLGHYVSLLLLCVTTVGCFYYSFKKGLPYAHDQVKSPTPYFDYVVLLGCLLFVSVLGYAQFLFNFLDESIQEVTLFTAVVFFVMAYRFDHIGVLSMAVTALAAFWGIRVSPQQWSSSEIFSHADLKVVAIIFGAAVSIAALILDQRKIKPHFTFTYFNFCCLIFFTGSLAGLFDSSTNGIYILVIYVGCAAAVYFAFLKKSFLFLLYAFIFGYIATTYLLALSQLDEPVFWFLYMLGSCAGFVWFIIRFKNFFKRHE
jgi:hypothetical protein